MSGRWKTYLMQRATEGVVVTVEKSGKQYSGAQLIKLMRGVHEHTTVYEKLNRRLQDRSLLDRLLQFVAGEGGLFSNGFTLKQLFQRRRSACGTGPGAGRDRLRIHAFCSMRSMGCIRSWSKTRATATKSP